MFRIKDKVIYFPVHTPKGTSVMQSLIRCKIVDIAHNGTTLTYNVQSEVWPDISFFAEDYELILHTDVKEIMKRIAV